MPKPLSLAILLIVRTLAGSPRIGREFIRFERSFVLILLWVAIALSGGATLCAQTSGPGCAPQTANYPCVYVPSGENYTMAAINASTDTDINDISLPGHPDAVAISHDNASVYFSYSTSQQINGVFVTVYLVGVIDTRSNTVTSTTLPIGSQALQMAISPDGSQLWVVESAQLEVFNLQPNGARAYAIAAGQLGAVSFFSAALSPDSTTAYVAASCNNIGATSPCVYILSAKNSGANAANSPIKLNGLVDSSASIAVSADGAYAIRTITDFNSLKKQTQLGLAFLRTADNTLTYAFSTLTANASNYGLGIAPSGTIYVAAQRPNPSTPVNAILLFDLSTQKFKGTIATSSLAEGVAIAADGLTAYVDTDVSGVLAIDTLSGATTTISSSSTFLLQVAAMPSVEATINTQPVSSQTIEYGQTATLTVAAGGTPPFTYQWYQGAPGNLKNPVAGATTSTFTTPSLTANTNYWVQVNNVVAGGAVNSNAASIVVNPLAPPTIRLQPAGVTITVGNSATLNVRATGTPPFTYQWFVGNSGDTTNPVPGAANSSLLTAPDVTTNYWVQVSNSVGQANSTPAIVTVVSPPACTLALEGFRTTSSNFVSSYAVTAVANCTDPQNKPVAIDLNWGDPDPSASNVSSGSGPNFTASHTYASPTPCNGSSSLPCSYNITLTATDSLQLILNARYPTEVITTSIVPPIFSGQTSTFTVYLVSPSPPPPEKVKFACTTVTDASGSVVQASALGIECSSVPTVVTLSNVPTAVTIQVTTTGSAVAQFHGKGRLSGVFYAMCLPASMILLYLRRQRGWLKLVVILFVSLSLVDCGGGFKPISTSTAGTGATPPGDYQLTIVDEPDTADGTSANGFIQISLIVPISVSQTQ